LQLQEVLLLLLSHTPEPINLAIYFKPESSKASNQQKHCGKKEEWGTQTPTDSDRISCGLLFEFNMGNGGYRRRRVMFPDAQMLG